MEPGLETPQLITPDSSFEVDGVIYTASADISIPRYKRYLIWQTEFGFDASFQSQYQDKLEIRRLINEQKSISEIAYINEAGLRAMQSSSRELIYQLCVCALWYNAPNENSAEYNHDAIVAKMNRWEAAGLGVGFFFIKAAGLVKSFREIWLQSAAPETPESDPSLRPPLPPS